jgi:hypothetical protein
MNNVVGTPPAKTSRPVGCPAGSAPNCLQYPLCNIATSDDFLGSAGSWSGTEYLTMYGASATRCGNTRLVFNDPSVKTAGNSTRWDQGYLQWYFSDNVEVDPESDGTTIYQEMLLGQRTIPCLVAEGFPATYSSTAVRGHRGEADPRQAPDTSSVADSAGSRVLHGQRSRRRLSPWRSAIHDGPGPRSKPREGFEASRIRRSAETPTTSIATTLRGANGSPSARTGPRTPTICAPRTEP